MGEDLKTNEARVPLDSAQRSAAPSIDSAQRSAAPSIDSAQRSAAPSIDSAQRSAAPSIETGQLVGNYRILGPLARGGMGEVFRAVHQYIERRAAIKVLYPELSRNPQFAQRFLNEARAVNLVQHPGLVEIYEFGLLSDGTAYLVMELLTGESLARVLARAAGRPIERALPIARQIALALAAAHRAGIVHRDLKPDNVMLVPDQDRPDEQDLRRVKILDFGIAKMSPPGLTPPGVGTGSGPDGAQRGGAPFIEPGPETKTRSGVALGTPEYMSPEQCTGAAVDGKADVYALGVLLFEMLAGRLPFQAELAFDLMAMHVRQAPPPLRALAPWVSEPVAALVAAMLAKDPAQRPSMADAALFLDAQTPLPEDARLTPAEREARLPQLDPTRTADVGLLPTVMPATELPTPTGATAQAAALEARRRRILLVDDEPSLVQVMRLMLESHGYEVRSLPDGSKVMDEVLIFQPELVILDVELPGKTGYKLCWEIKSNPQTQHTLVMFLSGRALEEDHKLGMAMRADAYMDKPFQVPSLLSVIEVLLAPRGPISGPGSGPSGASARSGPSARSGGSGGPKTGSSPPRG